MSADEIEWLLGGEEPEALSDAEDAHLPRRTDTPHTRHRISNMLAVVRSIARRTAATSRTLEEYTLNFDGRLGAYSRFLALLSEDIDGGVDFGSLLADELLSVQAHEGDQVSVSGPSIHLQPKAAEIVGLAFHELAANSIRHGAFGQPGGKVDVSWRIERDASGEALIFDWTESCGPPLALVPRRRGFGFELLEDTLVFQLDAQTELRFERAGFRCQIRLPVTGQVFVLPLRVRLATE
jgi:two-component system CheB/CheR fusion protein